MEKIRKCLSPIITICCYALLVFLMLAEVRRNENASLENFLTYTCIGAVIMVGVYIVWLPTGKEKGEKQPKVIANSLIYNARANYIVNNQKYKELKEFCKKTNEDYKDTMIRNKLSTELLTFEDFEKFKCKTFTPEDYTKRQLKLMKKLLDKPIKFKPLMPTQITIGRNKLNGLVPTNKEHINNGLMLFGKVVLSLGMGLIMTYLTLGRKGFTIDALWKLCSWTFTILFTIYSAIDRGYTSVVIDRNNYLVEENDLCNQFFQFISVPTSEADPTSEEIDKAIEKTKLK